MENQKKSEEKKPRYGGILPSPTRWDNLEQAEVPVGRDLIQCPDCGFWMSDKPSPQEEKEHLRQCKPVDEYWRRR